MRDTILDPMVFRIDMPTKDEMSFAFGGTRFTLPLEDAYELQYQLASALAQLELTEYPEAFSETCLACSEVHSEAHSEAMEGLESSRSAWESLVDEGLRPPVRGRRLDS